MIKIPSFVATGIGSVPHTEVQEAMEVIKKGLPVIPHWPQLPKISAAEGLIGQNTALLTKIGLIVDNGQRAPYFDTAQDDWAEKLTVFYTDYLGAVESEEILEEFAYPVDYAAGLFHFLEHFDPALYRNALFVKGQVTGPVTLGLTITDQNRKSAYYNDELKDLVLKIVEQNARWQVKALAKLGRPVIVFADEPGLYAYGQSTHITLKSNEIKNELNQVFDAVSDAGGIPGVHCCASTDWSILLRSNATIISFDAFEYFEKFAAYAKDILGFLERGGILAWGIVPTSDKINTHTADDLVKLLLEQIGTLVAKGVPEGLLKSQALITPSCGTGTLSPEQAELVYTVMGEVSRKMLVK